MGYSIKRNERRPQYIQAASFDRDRIRGGESLLSNRSRLAVALFRSIRESFRSALRCSLHTHTHTQKRDQVPSFPSARVIQWISQLCIYHYDSIHLDGSLSLDDRWRANMHKHAQKGNEKRKVEEEEEEDGWFAWRRGVRWCGTAWNRPATTE